MNVIRHSPYFDDNASLPNNNSTYEPVQPFANLTGDERLPVLRSEDQVVMKARVATRHSPNLSSFGRETSSPDQDDTHGSRAFSAPNATFNSYNVSTSPEDALGSQAFQCLVCTWVAPGNAKSRQYDSESPEDAPTSQAFQCLVSSWVAPGSSSSLPNACDHVNLSPIPYVQMRDMRTEDPST